MAGKDTPLQGLVLQDVVLRGVVLPGVVLQGEVLQGEAMKGVKRCRRMEHMCYLSLPHVPPPTACRPNPHPTPPTSIVVAPS